MVNIVFVCLLFRFVRFLLLNILCSMTKVGNKQQNYNNYSQEKGVNYSGVVLLTSFPRFRTALNTNWNLHFATSGVESKRKRAKVSRLILWKRFCGWHFINWRLGGERCANALTFTSIYATKYILHRPRAGAELLCARLLHLADVSLQFVAANAVFVACELLIPTVCHIWQLNIGCCGDIFLSRETEFNWYALKAPNAPHYHITALSLETKIHNDFYHKLNAIKIRYQVVMAKA